MGPKAATTESHTRCLRCGRYFARIQGHLALSPECKAFFEAAEEAEHVARLAARRSGSDRHQENPGDASYMDIDNDDPSMLASEQFLADEPGPSKRPHMFSPESEDTSHISSPPPSSVTPINAFSLYERKDFCNSGKIFAVGQETKFEEIRCTMPEGHPYYPFFNAQEWSLVEWLGTVGLSKKKIDAYLKTPWVCDMH